MRNLKYIMLLLVPMILLNCAAETTKKSSDNETAAGVSSVDSASLANIVQDSLASIQANVNEAESKVASENKIVSTISERDRLENEKFRIAELKRREALRSGKDISEITLADIGEKPARYEEKFEKIITEQPVKAQKEEKKKKVIKPVVKKETTKKVVKQKPSKTISKIPKITFETKEYSFDTITEGDVINYSFKFSNTGDSPLEVIKAEASCGCTRPSFPFLAIAPGEQGTIGVTYNSRTKSGNQKPEIQVYTNYQDDPITLYLTGYVNEKPQDLEEAKLDTTDH